MRLFGPLNQITLVAGDLPPDLSPSAPGVSLSVQSFSPRHCAVASNDRWIVAFKGMAFGPDLDAAMRYDAAAVCQYLLERVDASGPESTSSITGRFQMYVVDRQSGDYWVVTDRQGSAEVFTATEGGRSVVASSLSALGRGGVPLCLNRSAEDFLLTYGFVPPPETILDGVMRVPSGTIVIGRGASLRLESRPAVGGAKVDIPADTDAAIEALGRGFDAAIEALLPEAKKVAVFLGGFDSALVAAALAAKGRDVHTYTFRYADARYNQPFAEELAAHIGGEHHWVDITPEAIADGLERFGHEVNAPTNWPAYVIQTRLVAEQMASAGHAVGFSGDGCDNLFFGYPLTYRRGQVVGHLSRLPDRLLGAGRRVAAQRQIRRFVGRPAVVASGLLANAQLSDPARSYLTFRILDSASLDDIRGGERIDDARDPEVWAADLAAPFAGLDPVQLSYQGKKTLTPSAMKMTAAGDVAGVSIVSPYQHPAMSSVAKALPTDLLRPTDGRASSVGKWALVQMAERRGLLPPEVIHQPKLAAADAPIDEWYPNDLRSAIETEVSALPFAVSAVELDAMFTASPAERLWARAISGETSNVVNLYHDLSLLATYGAMARALNVTR